MALRVVCHRWRAGGVYIYIVKYGVLRVMSVYSSEVRIVGRVYIVIVKYGVRVVCHRWRAGGGCI
jgi:hypothetical protein